MARTSAITSEKVYKVSRAAANLPQTATTAYFTVSSGDATAPAIEIIGIFGSAATAIQAQACNLKIEHSIQGDMCANLDINGDTQFTSYSITGAPATALADSTPALMATSRQLIFNGDIELTTSASNTGTTSWIVYYRKLQEDATVVTA